MTRKAATNMTMPSALEISRQATLDAAGKVVGPS